MSRGPKRRKRLVRAAKVAVAILAVLVLLNAYVVQRGRVTLSSMEPTLSGGEWVLFEKLVRRRGGPRRFDIVVFKAPNDPDKVFIKRVVGLPNEVVEAREGVLYVDNTATALPTGVDWGSVEFGPSLVTAAHYFVVGDNPAESQDSRAWGCVPRDYVLGRVFWRFWPPGRWRIFGREDVRQPGVEDADTGVQADKRGPARNDGS